jgi:hypothetical protein
MDEDSTKTMQVQRRHWSKCYTYHDDELILTGARLARACGKDQKMTKLHQHGADESIRHFGRISATAGEHTSGLLHEPAVTRGLATSVHAWSFAALGGRVTKWHYKVRATHQCMLRDLLVKSPRKNN